MDYGIQNGRQDGYQHHIKVIGIRQIISLKWRGLKLIFSEFEQQIFGLLSQGSFTNDPTISVLKLYVSGY